MQLGLDELSAVTCEYEKDAVRFHLDELILVQCVHVEVWHCGYMSNCAMRREAIHGFTLSDTQPKGLHGNRIAEQSLETHRR
jgi:hypothetical protein